MAISVAEAEEYYDKLIQESDAIDLITRTYPIFDTLSKDTTENTTTFAHLSFLSGVEGRRPRVYTVFDLIDAWPQPDGFDLSKWADKIKKDGLQTLSELPDGLKPAAPLPPGPTMSIIVLPPSEGNLRAVVKFLTFTRPVTGAQAQKFLSGRAGVAPHRPNVLGAKKALYMILGRLEGQRLLYGSVQQRPEGSSAIRRSLTWDPTPEELLLGFQHINSKAKHLGIADNQQYLWVLQNIRDPTSPIFGWPEGKVEKACNNLARAKSQTDYDTFYPLCLMDLKRVFFTKILPLVVPYLGSFGLLIVGAAGKGKTQLAKMLAKALGTWRLSAKPDLGNFTSGWRRGSQTVTLGTRLRSSRKTNSVAFCEMIGIPISNRPT